MTKLILSVLVASTVCSHAWGTQKAAVDTTSESAAPVATVSAESDPSQPDSAAATAPASLSEPPESADAEPKKRPAALGEPASETSSLFGIDLTKDLNADQVANPAKSETEKSRSSTASNIASIMTGLTVVLLIVIVLSFALKKGSFSLTGAGGLLRIKGGLNLGPKEKIAVVSVGGKDLVVGMTQHSINLIYVFEEGLNERPGSVSSPPPPQSEVARRFKELLASDSHGKNGPLGQ